MGLGCDDEIAAVGVGNIRNSKEEPVDVVDELSRRHETPIVRQQENDIGLIVDVTDVEALGKDNRFVLLVFFWNIIPAGWDNGEIGD
jgi:hypothetical protein